MSPYFISDMKQNERDIEDYSTRPYLFYMQRNLRGQNPLTLNTFQEAIRYGGTGSVRTPSPLSQAPYNY